jgi:hypothetical protein
LVRGDKKTILNVFPKLWEMFCLLIRISYQLLKIHKFWTKPENNSPPLWKKRCQSSIINPQNFPSDRHTSTWAFSTRTVIF